MTGQSLVVTAWVGLLALGAVSCVHKIAVPVPIVVPVPVVLWTIPLGADDDARFCVATQLAAWVDPADVWPLRCVSVGAVRAWIRAQRLAN